MNQTYLSTDEYQINIDVTDMASFNNIQEHILIEILMENTTC